MRTLLVSALLALAALAAVPSASAASVPAAQPLPLCVPPGVESFGVCAGLVDGDVCAWIWLGPSLRIVCLGDVTASTSTSAAALPVGCATDAVGVCLQREADGTGACVLVHFGLQGAGACADTDPLGVRVCSTVRSVFWDGNCPTDGLLTTTLA